ETRGRPSERSERSSLVRRYPTLPFIQSFLKVVALLLEEAPGTIWFSRFANITSVEDQKQGEIGPAVFGHRGREVLLYLARILVYGEAEAVRYPRHVGVDYNGRFAVGETHDHVGRF